MSGHKKLKILKEVLGSPFYHGKENLFYCPKCKHHKKKMSINLDKNKFHEKYLILYLHGASKMDYFDAIYHTLLTSARERERERDKKRERD